MRLFVSNVYADMPPLPEAEKILFRGEPVVADAPDATTLDELKERGITGAYVEVEESLYSSKLKSGMCEEEIIAEALGNRLAQIHGYGDYII
jgi:hypothetical protein